MQSSNFQRGMQLFELGRYTEAISYFSQDLEQWDNKYMLALSYYRIGDLKKSESLSNGLLEEAPDNPNVFFLKSQIALHQDRDKEALSYINEALGINPYDADYFGLKGAILLQLKKYEEGLVAINEGLAIDPKNNFCLNTRAQLLTKLDRKQEAAHTIEDILLDNPEESYSHANVGWVALENNQLDKALSHFKEALRYDPNFEYAREGMSKALKAKNLIYRSYLKYEFWIAKQSSKNQWVFIIGIYIAYRIGIKALNASGLTFLAIPLIFLYLFFALGSWIMEPMSNTILSFNAYGKYLLSEKQKWSGYLFGLLLITAIFSTTVFYLTTYSYFLVLAIACAAALIPLPRAFLQYSSKARYFGIGVGVLLLLIGVFGILIIPNATTLITACILIMIAYTWVANVFN